MSALHHGCARTSGAVWISFALLDRASVCDGSNGGAGFDLLRACFGRCDGQSSGANQATLSHREYGTDRSGTADPGCLLQLG